MLYQTQVSPWELFMNHSSNDNTLPLMCTQIVGIQLRIPAVTKAIERVCLEVANADRGSLSFNGASNDFVFHLVLNQTDKDAVGPFFDSAEEIWLVVASNTTPDIPDVSTPEHFIEGVFD